jgi:hypothetical protein
MCVVAGPGPICQYTELDGRGPQDWRHRSALACGQPTMASSRFPDQRLICPEQHFLFLGPAGGRCVRVHCHQRD